MQAYTDFVRSNFWEIAFGIWFLVSYTALNAILKEIRTSTTKIVQAINDLEITMKPRDEEWERLKAKFGSDSPPRSQGPPGLRSPYRFAHRMTACGGLLWFGLTSQLAPVSPMVLGVSAASPAFTMHVALTMISSAPHVAGFTAPPSISPRTTRN
jgi:hypothetical protein